MRMPAPCGTLWKDRSTCDQARFKNDSLREDFQTAEVIVMLRPDYNDLQSRVQLLEKKLHDAGIDPEE